MTRFGWEGDHQQRSNTRRNSDRDTNVHLGLVVVREKVVEIINGVVTEKRGALYGGTKKPACQVELPRNCHRRSIVGLVWPAQQFNLKERGKRSKWVVSFFGRPLSSPEAALL